MRIVKNAVEAFQINEVRFIIVIYNDCSLFGKGEDLKIEKKKDSNYFIVYARFNSDGGTAIFNSLFVSNYCVHEN